MSGSGMRKSRGAVFFGELLMRIATKRCERFVQAREVGRGAGRIQR